MHGIAPGVALQQYEMCDTICLPGQCIVMIILKMRGGSHGKNKKRDKYTDR